METIKGAALYLTASSREGASSFAERRAELLSGKRAGKSLTSNNSAWVQDHVAANDIEERMAAEAAAEAAAKAAAQAAAVDGLKYARPRRTPVTRAVDSIVNTAVTMAVGPDEPIDGRLLPPRRESTSSSSPAPPAQRVAPAPPTARHENRGQLVDDEPRSAVGGSALDRMAAFLNADPFDSVSLAAPHEPSSNDAPAVGRFITPAAPETARPPRSYPAAAEPYQAAANPYHAVANHYLDAATSLSPYQAAGAHHPEELRPQVGSVVGGSSSYAGSSSSYAGGGYDGDGALDMDELAMAPPPVSQSPTAVSDKPKVGSLFGGGFGGGYGGDVEEPAMAMPPPPASQSPTTPSDKPKIGSLFGGGFGGGALDADEAIAAAGQLALQHDEFPHVTRAFAAVPPAPPSAGMQPPPPPSAPPARVPARIEPQASPARPVVARRPPPATASSSARHTIEDGLPADIDDWLDDLDSDVEELPGMTAEAPLAPLPSTRVPLEVT